MSLAITRTARRTLNALTLGWYGRQQQKQMPMMWPQWYNGNPQWRMVDSKAYIEEGYGMNSIIYSAVTWKAKNVTQAPMRAYTGDHENPELLPVKHPLSQLIARPNVYQTQRQFMTLLEVFLNVSGNAFILLDRPYLNKPPVAMYPLSTEHVRIVPINGREVGYLFVPDGSDQRNGTPILASDMIHIKLPNPLDPLEGQGFGLSPIAAMAKTADSDNRATGYIYNLFRRGVMMGGVLSFKDPISDEVLARTRTRWQEQYGGSERWDRIGILDNGANYERIVPTFDELGFGPIDERSETRMLAPFGVPPIVVGSRIGLMRSTYANYENARKAAWEDTLLYEINLFGEDFEYHLSPDDETFVRPDISQVFAFKENRTEQVTTAKTLFDMGVPPRIAFATAGLRVEEYEGMDTSWMSSSLHDANAEPAPIPTALQPFAGGQQQGQDGEDVPPADPENEGTVNAEDVEGDTPSKSPKKGVNSGKKKRMRPTPTHRWS